MKITALKADLLRKGILDERQLLTYATLSGTIQNSYFQNIVALCFQKEQVQIYRANLDNTLGNLLLECPYEKIINYVPHNRILYSYTEMTYEHNQLKFFNYNKKVFAQGFRDGGLEIGEAESH